MLAKSFCAVTNLEKLKHRYISKVYGMDDAKFQRRFSRAYQVLKELPLSFRQRFGVAETMTKEEAIGKIASLEKDTVYQMIDAVPNQFIAGQFKGYLRKTKREVEASNLVGQVKTLWGTIIEKIKRE